MASIKRNIIIFGFLSLLAFLSQMVFAFTTSFLYDMVMNFDQGIFEIIGRDWAEGHLPYIETWDSKGPIIFFFNMLGYLMGGRTAIFWIEVVNLSLCLIVIYLFAVKHLSSVFSLVATVFVLFAYITVCSGGNQVSDYSLLPAIGSMVVFYQWTHRLQTRRQIFHPWQYALIYGIFFAASLLSRLTNAAALCLMILIVFVYLVRHHLWHNLLENTIGFVVGFALLFVPFALYFGLHGAFAEMWYAMLEYNVEYALVSNPEKVVQSSSNLVYSLLYFSPVIVLLFVNILNLLFNPRRRKLNMLWALVAIAVLLWLYKSYANANYGIIFSPFVVVAALEMRQITEVKPKFRLVGVVLFGFILLGFVNHVRVFRSYTHEVPTYRQIMKGLENKVGASFVAYNCEPDIYLSLGIKPYYRFFVCQDWAIKNGASLLQKVRETYTKGNAEWILVQDFETSKVRDILEKRYLPYRRDKANNLLLLRLNPKRLSNHN